MNETDSRSSLRRHLLLLTALAALLFLSGNSILPLVDRDEPRFSEAAREMLEQRDWIIPWFNGQYRFDKPPLIYWCQIVCYQALGETPFAARLPSVLFGIGTVLLIYGFGRRLHSPAIGLRAAVMFATCLQTIVHARLAVADLAMIFAEDDLAALLFTSGTAGAPKAAMLTHGNLAANLRQNMASGGKTMRPDDVSLCVLPLFHIMGLNSMLNLNLYVGATLVLQERFDPMTVFETIKEEQVSVLVGPPTVWSALSQIDLVGDDALASIRIAVSGAAMLPNRVVEEVMGRFGVRILEGYGLTEASPGVMIAREDDTPVGSIGRPMADMEVRIVDAAGDDVYIGDEGEIIVRGPNIFAGYLDDPEATARALDADGWLRTGDIGVVDDDGYVYLVDRAKDLIIVSGFNVFPAEVERVLNAHPGVVESGVVGVAHPHTGESVKAFVVPEPGRVLEEDDLIEWCATELARYKCPTKIDVVDEIPRGLGGKIIRRELTR